MQPCSYGSLHLHKRNFSNLHDRYCVCSNVIPYILLCSVSVQCAFQTLNYSSLNHCNCAIYVHTFANLLFPSGWENFWIYVEKLISLRISALERVKPEKMLMASVKHNRSYMNNVNGKTNTQLSAPKTVNWRV